MRKQRALVELDLGLLGVRACNIVFTYNPEVATSYHDPGDAEEFDIATLETEGLELSTLVDWELVLQALREQEIVT